MFDAYKRFFHFAGAQKSTWYKGMAFEFVRSIFEAFQFFALLVVFRALVENKMSGATAALAFGIMAVSVAGAALFWYLAHNSEGHANYQMCAEKRIHIGERMKYMPMGYFNAQSLGSLTAAATSTMDDLESMSFAVIARTMVGMIRTAIFSLAIFFFDWRIGAVFLLGMLLFLWVNARLLKKSRQLSPGRLAAQTKLVDAVLEYIQGMSVVRAFHGERAAKQTLNDTIIETERQNFKLERKRLQCAGTDCAACDFYGGDSAFGVAFSDGEHVAVYLFNDGDLCVSGLQRAGICRRDVFHAADDRCLYRSG